MLCKPRKLLQLFEILIHHYDSLKPRHVTLLQQLFLNVYSELPFPEQDLVVMEIHSSGIVNVGEMLCWESEGNMTNIFNRLSAETDPDVSIETYVHKT